MLEFGEDALHPATRGLRSIRRAELVRRQQTVLVARSSTSWATARRRSLLWLCLCAWVREKPSPIERNWDPVVEKKSAKASSRESARVARFRRVRRIRKANSKRRTPAPKRARSANPGGQPEPLAALEAVSAVDGLDAEGSDVDVEVDDARLPAARRGTGIRMKVRRSPGARLGRRAGLS